MPRLQLGTMFHGFNYPDETGKAMLQVRLWQPVMERGCIHFIRPEACTLVRDIREVKAKRFLLGDIESVTSAELELGGDEA